MKKAVSLLSLFAFSVTAAYAGGFSKLENLRAADFEIGPAAAIEVPVPAAPVKEDPVPQDLVYKFNNAAGELRNLRNGLTWVRNDIDSLERKARRIIQTNSQDSFFQFDLRRMSSDMSRRVNDMRRISYDVKNLLNLAQKSKQLNDIARNMDWDARDIMNDAWPGMENSSQRLERTVRSGKPEIIGSNSQWTARDISRNCRDFSYQARNTYYDVQSLVNKTQP
ncbi:MAG: hypothetical protein KKH28_01255 [Elusimicrobia bacterium]|nr:hypothetical protein [Elusimicrobiota bacterium]